MWNLIGGGGNALLKALAFFASTLCFFARFVILLYTFLLGFVFMVAAIVNFYYFRIYGSKIDVFIFGLKDDDTGAILQIMWQDYPVLLALLCSLLCGVGTLYLFRLSARFLSKLQVALSAFSVGLTAFMYGCLIVLLIIASRGSLGTYPIIENQHYISSLPLFNHLCTNPLIALDWARSNYKSDISYTKPDVKRGGILQNRLFPLLRTSPHSEFLRQNPPHVVISLMESFGSNMLVYDSISNDLLGSLRGHLKEDFVFYRFLSGQHGTIASFSALFFQSPSAKISLGSYKKIQLPYNPFAIYAQAGYDVVYITSGYASWQGLGEYIKIQGAQRIYDAISLMEHYKESRSDLSTYGVPDEYACKMAFEILSRAQKPTFIVILTTSNHPPYHLPHSYKPKPIALPSQMLQSITPEMGAKIELAAKLYQYANNALGDFVSHIKQSDLASRTIIAASGDHRVRDFIHNPSEDKALQYAVPFYIYVPQAYAANLRYDPARVGSHKDILPTLYELSLSGTTYLSLGGRNMLASHDEARYAFGYNSSLWIDERGIYPIPSAVGYMWQDSKDFRESSKHFGLLSLDTTFKLKQEEQDFPMLYSELINYSIAWRIYGAQAE